jgi:hypothetical protein
MPWVACHSSVIEVGEPDHHDMRERAGREHAQTQNAQDAPEEGGRQARRPKRTIQSEEMGDPQDKDHQVQAVLNRASRSDVGKPDHQSLGFGRVQSHEHTDQDEDENEDDAAQDTGQATPSRKSVAPHPLRS